jgi:hypothetical protein
MADESPSSHLEPPEPDNDERLVGNLLRRKAMIILAGVLVVTVLGLLVLSLTKENPAIEGSITLITSLSDASMSFEGSSPSVGDTCSGLGGYGDMDAGLQVQVRDEDGTLLANGHATKGELTEVYEDIILACTLRFTVEDVPHASFYSIEAGSRGELTYSRKQIEQQDWKVDFSLGR